VRALRGVANDLMIQGRQTEQHRFAVERMSHQLRSVAVRAILETMTRAAALLELPKNGRNDGIMLLVRPTWKGRKHEIPWEVPTEH